MQSPLFPGKMGTSGDARNGKSSHLPEEHGLATLDISSWSLIPRHHFYARAEEGRRQSFPLKEVIIKDEPRL